MDAELLPYRLATLPANELHCVSVSKDTTLKKTAAPMFAKFCVKLSVIVKTILRGYFQKY